MMMTANLRLAVLGSIIAVGCAGRPVDRVVGSPVGTLAPQETLLEDTTPKAELRMVPPEVYMRTYLQLFGGLMPLDAQQKARGPDGNNLFDTWDDYVSSLGFPDYRLDIPRQTQTNALMVASFERLGIALCDRAVERDLAMLDKNPPKPAPPAPPPASASAHPLASAHPVAPMHSGSAAPAHSAAPLHSGSAAPAPPVPPPLPVILAIKDRVVFAFDPAVGPMDEAQFAPRFDVLHRTFLGYPASLAPPEREARYLALYRDIAANHVKAMPKSRFTPEQAAWSAVCYGLIRHPEFHLY